MTAAEARAAEMVLRVDPITCDGRGLCAEVVPELIGMDDWGFPIIADGVVPSCLRPAAAEAVRMCPKLALRLGPALEAADPYPKGTVTGPGRGW